MKISNRKKIVYYTLLTIMAIIVITPLIFAVLLSFSNNTDILNGLFIPSSISFGNYEKAFRLQPFGK